MPKLMNYIIHYNFNPPTLAIMNSNTKLNENLMILRNDLFKGMFISVMKFDIIKST